MSSPPLNNPNAHYWDDLVEDFGLTLEEQEAVRSGAERIIAEVQAKRLAEVRKLKTIADFGDETYVLG